MNPKNWAHPFSVVLAVPVDVEAFFAAAKNAGLRETICKNCKCRLLTRGASDYCPPCREKS